MKISNLLKKLVFATMICLAGVASVSAEDAEETTKVEKPAKEKKPHVSKYKAGKFGLGGSVATNQFTHDGKGLALQYGGHFDYTLFDDIKLGVQVMADTDLAGGTIALDPMIYAKYYIPYTFLLFTPFAEADIGASVLLGTNAEDKFKGANFAIGAAAGISMKMGPLYIEPSIGFAYPSALNVKVAAGVNFKKLQMIFD